MKDNSKPKPNLGRSNYKKPPPPITAEKSRRISRFNFSMVIAQILS